MLKIRKLTTHKSASSWPLHWYPIPKVHPWYTAGVCVLFLSTRREEMHKDKILVYICLYLFYKQLRELCFLPAIYLTSDTIQITFQIFRCSMYILNTSSLINVRTLLPLPQLLKSTQLKNVNSERWCIIKEYNLMSFSTWICCSDGGNKLRNIFFMNQCKWYRQH